ncbi:hypothetical protein VKT23_000229 [Stygiomarasmius scandens]|uniref:Uncharacterized protein n=1 Tax=Marasmiellus scandens TaxID=2682957 RepID=A0ABR1K3V7_9AGAR
MALPTAAVIGIIVAALLLLCSVAAIVFYTARLRKVRRRRKILEDSTDTFLARASRVEKSREASDTPLLFEPLDFEAQAYDYLPKSTLQGSRPPPKLSPVRRSPSSERPSPSHGRSRSRESSAPSTISRNTAQTPLTPQMLADPWNVHQPLRPPALIPPGSGASFSSSASSLSPATPSTSSFSPLSPNQNQSSPRKSPPNLTPLVIPSKPKKTVTPAAYASQRPVATIDPLSSATTVKPLSIPSQPRSHNRGVSLADPGLSQSHSRGVSLVDSGSQSHSRGVSLADPGFAPANILVRTSSDAETDSASLYSQSSAFTQGHRAPWADVANAPSVPEIPDRFKEYYALSRTQSNSLGDPRGSTESRDSRALGKTSGSVDLKETGTRGSEDTKDSGALSRRSSIDVDINAGGFSNVNSSPGLKLPPPPETPLDEDPLTRSSTNVGRLLKARAKRQNQDDTMLSRNASKISRIERDDSIKSIRSVATLKPAEDKKESYAQRMKRIRVSRTAIAEESESGSTKSPASITSPGLQSSPLEQPSSSIPRSPKTLPSLTTQSLPNPFEASPSVSPSTTIGTMGTSGTSVIAPSYDPFSTEAIKAYPLPLNRKLALPTAPPVKDDGASDNQSVVPEVGNVGTVVPAPRY